MTSVGLRSSVDAENWHSFCEVAGVARSVSLKVGSIYHKVLRTWINLLAATRSLQADKEITKAIDLTSPQEQYK